MQKTAFHHEVSVSEMQHLRDEGLSNKDIALRVGCSTGTVCKYLESKRKARAKLTEDDCKDIVSLYQQGSSPQEIAEAYGCCIASVYNILKQNGIELRKKRTKPETKSEPEPEPQQESEMPDISSKQPGRGDMTVYQMGLYVGWKGTYNVNFTEHTVELPDIGRKIAKNDLGFYIRDLMAVWKEM